jgi:hypothetical protein
MAEQVVVQPNSVHYVPLRVVEVEKQAMPPGDGILTGCESFMQSSDLHPWLGSLVTCKPDGTLWGGVMNTLQQEVTIQSGVKYGHLSAPVLWKSKQTGHGASGCWIHWVVRQNKVQRLLVSQISRKRQMQQELVTLVGML